MQTISIDINKVQKGNEAEFRLLFNLFYPRLMSVACRFVPEHIAEDIVQSVFVMYWEQKSTLTPNAIHSFLYKCTQNNCLNYLKHQAVVLGHEEEVRLAEERMAFQLAGSDANELWNEVVERDIRGTPTCSPLSMASLRVKRRGRQSNRVSGVMFADGALGVPAGRSERMWHAWRYRGSTKASTA